MSLRDWAESGWPRPHKTGRQEAAGLLGIVERDIADAGQGISADEFHVREIERRSGLAV